MLEGKDMSAVLRHAGSANPDKPGSAYGNQQYAGHGVSRKCDRCCKPVRLGGGWKKYGPGKLLWSCPACTRDAQKSGVA